MRRSTDFSTAVRSGRRARRGGVVVHHHVASRVAGPDGHGNAPALVGFIVGRGVGGSVARHRTARRLRAIMADHLAELPEGSATVVRALPGAANSTSARLADDLDAALGRLVAKSGS
jgi:ribonuclease P protein component